MTPERLRSVRRPFLAVAAGQRIRLPDPGDLRERLSGLASRHPLVAFHVRAAVVLGMFLMLERVTTNLIALPPDVYQRPFLVLEALRHLGAVRVTVAVALLAALWRFGHLRGHWSAMEADGPVRLFVCALALVLVWMASAYGYNYFAAHGHYFDRALVLALWVLLWRRPVFILPLVAMCCVLIGQAAAPALGGTFLAHPLQLVHVLNAFGAAWLVFAVTGARSADSFLFVAACIVGGGYFVSAVEKLRIGWLTYGHLDLMPLTAYAHGWLGLLQPSDVVRLSRGLAWLDWPLRVGVLAVELAFVALLWQRTLAMALLAVAIAFHAGIFALNGFLFWNWIVLDAALLALLRMSRFDPVRRIFGIHYLPLSMLLIAFAGRWADAPRLAWFDTPLATAYPVEAIGQSGTRYRLPPTYFAPYQDVFTMSSFAYLTREHAVLTRAYGVVFDRALADRLVRATDPEDVFRLERLAGPVRPDAERAAELTDFIRSFVANRSRIGEPFWVSQAIRPLRLYWSFGRGNEYHGQEAIESVVVLEDTWFFDGNRLERIRQLEVGRVSIPEHVDER
jgi:hypothetical protein